MSESRTPFGVVAPRPDSAVTATEWTLATVHAAAQTIAHAHGLGLRAFIVGGGRRVGIAVRIEMLREAVSGAPGSPSLDRLLSETAPSDFDTREVTCWIELPATDLDTADAEPRGVAELVEREVAQVLRLRHGRGSAA